MTEPQRLTTKELDVKQLRRKIEEFHIKINKPKRSPFDLRDFPVNDLAARKWMSTLNFGPYR